MGAGPLACIVEDQGHRGLGQRGTSQTSLREALQVPSQLADVTEDCRVLAGMRQHGRVELFRASPGLPPLEVADGISTKRQVSQGVALQLSGLLAGVDRPPVDRRGGLLHKPPGTPAGDGIHQAGGIGQLLQMIPARRHIVVVGHKVHLVAPVVVVQGESAGADHEVGGQRYIRGDLSQGVPLGHVEILEGVGAEPLEVQHAARILEIPLADKARRQNLREVAQPL